MNPRALPIALELVGKRVVVFGGDDEAAQRAIALLEAGAEVLHVWPSRPSTLPREVRHVARHPAASDLDDVWLAVLTERDAELAAALFAAAEARRVFFCATDRPERSFQHLALVRSSWLTVAIGTEGRAPGLAARLRQEFARLFGEAEFARFVDAIVALRDGAPPPARRAALAPVLAALRLDGALLYQLPEVPRQDVDPAPLTSPGGGADEPHSNEG